MILLELTEKEARTIEEIISIEKESLLESDIGFSEQERKRRICESLMTKINDAFRPKPDLLITAKDFLHLKSLAKGEWHNLRGDLKISNKEVDKEDIVKISLANALIMWLNGNNLLKRLAKFDYTDDSFEYEESE